MVDINYEDDLPGSIYHYTDFAALQGIYENGELWATNSRYLNDISEMQLGPRIMTKLLWQPIPPKGEKLSKQLKIATAKVNGLRKNPDDAAGVYLVEQEDLDEAMAFFKKTIDEASDFSEAAKLTQELQAACSHALEDTTCFIFSMSEEPDQLSQWRAYGKDGVCIELSTTALLNALNHAPALRANMQRVQYNDDTDATEDDFIRPIIDFASSRRAQLIADGVELEPRKVIIGQEMMTKIAFLKDTAFEEEKEVRIAVQGNPNHFTPHRYGIVPRMKLPITLDVIKSVTVGPSAHSDLRVQSLEMYFANCDDKKGNRGNILVRSSKVPYRDW